MQLTTSSPALISTSGSIIKRDSRLSGVDVFLRPDKGEPLSADVVIDPNFELLLTEGDREDGEETFDIGLRTLLPAVLSDDDEGAFFVVETDNDALVDGL